MSNLNDWEDSADNVESFGNPTYTADHIDGAATIKTLEKLHGLMAEVFIDDIVACKRAGIPMSASDKAVIVKFLKDSAIVANPDTDKSKEEVVKDEFKEDMAKRRAENAAKIFTSDDDSDLADLTSP
jgi:hypothetical protein